MSNRTNALNARSRNDNLAALTQAVRYRLGQLDLDAGVLYRIPDSFGASCSASVASCHSRKWVGATPGARGNTPHKWGPGAPRYPGLEWGVKGGPVVRGARNTVRRTNGPRTVFRSGILAELSERTHVRSNQQGSILWAVTFLVHPLARATGADRAPSRGGGADGLRSTDLSKG